jgi:hypothetical protein
MAGHGQAVDVLGLATAAMRCIAGELVRERGQEGRPTTMERAALTSRWGE